MALALLTAACGEVKEGLRSADQSLQGAFGTGSDPQTEQPANPAQANSAQAARADALYREGVAARARQDDSAALVTFEEAADLGHGPAAYATAIAYLEGRGTEQDLDKASAWLTAAADRGEPRALYLAGVNYEAGLGVEQDQETAVAFYAEAAALGHPEAQVKLAEAFSQGKGVPKDLAWAQRWFGKAAWQNNAEAQFSYGVLLAAGRGFARDNRAAHGWLALAAKAGYADAATARDAVERRLSPAQRARSRAWQAAFRPRSGVAPDDDPPTVRYLQQRLTDLDYRPGPVDGLPGPRTATAISQYRARSGLPAGNQIDSELIEALFQAAR